ncbi:hypothetical protein ACFQZC_32855 [Streptacidiphilus monticola]
MGVQALAGVGYPNSTVAFDGDATLLLYTDGVTEARGGDGLSTRSPSAPRAGPPARPTPSSPTCAATCSPTAAAASATTPRWSPSAVRRDIDIPSGSAP